MACGAQSVYVGNLPASASEAKLKEVFEGLNCEVRPPRSRQGAHMGVHGWGTLTMLGARRW